MPSDWYVDFDTGRPMGQQEFLRKEFDVTRKILEEHGIAVDEQGNVIPGASTQEEDKPWQVLTGGSVIFAVIAAIALLGETTPLLIGMGIACGIAAAVLLVLSRIVYLKGQD